VTRPPVLLFVAGTGTAVGKTWWTAATARRLRDLGVEVSVRKPVQSGEDGPSDAEILAAATGEDVPAVCPPHRTYAKAWAPPMAAAELGLPPYTVADLVAETRWSETTRVAIVESVGGPRSPIASDGDSADLARALRPDLAVLVADAGLGTINAVRLASSSLTGTALLVALNRFGGDPLHDRNREVLARDGFDVLTDVDALVRRVVALASGA
jgi:dethiobiotin synthetase